jgi:hypothetical protein
VIQLPAGGGTGSRSLFLAAVLTWSGEKPPTTDAIAGVPTLEQGKAHIVTIVRSGGKVLGNRPLELDGIQPELFLDAAGGPSVMLQRGLEVIGRASNQQRKIFPVLRTWGYGVPRLLADRAFCGDTG